MLPKKFFDVLNHEGVVKGYKDYQGTGFYLEGTARFLSEGPDYDRMKEKYDFLTRVLEITPTFVQQKI